jgi:multidrug transporter EmrE-like cation transporter
MSPGWLFVTAAAASNVLANVMLKKTVAALPPEGGLPALKAALAMGSFWAFAAGGAMLLVFYVLALKAFELSVVYAVVTSAALVGVLIVSAWFLGESAGPLKITGCILIAAGIFLISRP